MRNGSVDEAPYNRSTVTWEDRIARPSRTTKLGPGGTTGPLLRGLTICKVGFPEDWALPRNPLRPKIQAISEGNRMVRRLIRNQLPRKGLRVRVPCPPLFFLMVSDTGDPSLQAMRAGAS